MAFHLLKKLRKNAIVSLLTLKTDFNCRVILTCATQINFTRVNEIEAMCFKRSRVKVRNETLSTFTFMRDLSYIGFIFFTLMNSMRVRI